MVYNLLRLEQKSLGFPKLLRKVLLSLFAKKISFYSYFISVKSMILPSMIL